MKNINFIILFFIFFTFNGCGGGSSVSSKTDTQKNNLKREYSNQDSDNDYIPDNIEILIGTDITNSDQNNNGIIDGLESNGKFGDTLFNKEWFIYSIGQEVNNKKHSIKGKDLGLLKVYHNYMGYNNGKFIKVQVVDYGIEIGHEDLKDNISLSDSSDGGKIGNPKYPNQYYINKHGTKIAGIIAARGFNGKGIRGIAPFAKIAGSNWLINQNFEDLEKVWLGGKDIVVSNNSWGSYFTTNTIYEKIMEKAQSLRDNRGRSFVFAAGNDRSYGGDANLQYTINNRFAIAVAALDIDDTYAPYSTPGANIFISAYGGAQSSYDGPTITTTTLSGKSENFYSIDKKRNYTYAMNGTSAAAPMVSGIIALINEACPDLTYRDIKYLMAKNAKKIDIDNPSWVINDAGISFSTDYGFGKIDAYKTIQACKNGYVNLPKQQKIETAKIVNTKSNNINNFKITINQNIKIEHVELTIDINSTNASNYQIYLISPNNTKIKMLRGGSICNDSYFIPNCNWMNGGFRVSTPAFLDENSKGVWQIEIINGNNNDTDTIKSIKLKIYGYKG